MYCTVLPIQKNKKAVGSWDNKAISSCRRGIIGGRVRVARENVPLSFGCVNLGAKGQAKFLGVLPRTLFLAFVEREYRPYRIWVERAVEKRGNVVVVLPTIYLVLVYFPKKFCKIFSDSPLYQIFRRMHEVLNIDENKN